MYEAGMWFFLSVIPSLLRRELLSSGKSKDSVASHKRFEEKYGLAFTLADPERKVIEGFYSDVCGRKEEKLWKGIYGAW